MPTKQKKKSKKQARIKPSLDVSLYPTRLGPKSEKGLSPQYRIELAKAASTQNEKKFNDVGGNWVIHNNKSVIHKELQESLFIPLFDGDNPKAFSEIFYYLQSIKGDMRPLIQARWPLFYNATGHYKTIQRLYPSIYEQIENKNIPWVERKKQSRFSFRELMVTAGSSLFTNIINFYGIHFDTIELLLKSNLSSDDIDTKHSDEMLANLVQTAFYRGSHPQVNAIKMHARTYAESADIDVVSHISSTKIVNVQELDLYIQLQVGGQSEKLLGYYLDVDKETFIIRTEFSSYEFCAKDLMNNKVYCSIKILDSKLKIEGIACAIFFTYGHESMSALLEESTASDIIEKYNDNDEFFKLLEALYSIGYDFIDPKTGKNYLLDVLIKRDNIDNIQYAAALKRQGVQLSTVDPQNHYSLLELCIRLNHYGLIKEFLTDEENQRLLKENLPAHILPVLFCSKKPSNPLIAGKEHVCIAIMRDHLIEIADIDDEMVDMNDLNPQTVSLNYKLHRNLMTHAIEFIPNPDKQPNLLAYQMAVCTVCLEVGLFSESTLLIQKLQEYNLDRYISGQHTILAQAAQNLLITAQQQSLIQSKLSESLTKTTFTQTQQVDQQHGISQQLMYSIRKEASETSDRSALLYDHLIDEDKLLRFFLDHLQYCNTCHKSLDMPVKFINLEMEKLDKIKDDKIAQLKFRLLMNIKSLKREIEEVSVMPIETMKQKFDLFQKYINRLFGLYNYQYVRRKTLPSEINRYFNTHIIACFAQSVFDAKLAKHGLYLLLERLASLPEFAADISQVKLYFQDYYALIDRQVLLDLLPDLSFIDTTDSCQKLYDHLISIDKLPPIELSLEKLIDCFKSEMLWLMDYNSLDQSQLEAHLIEIDATIKMIKSMYQDTHDRLDSDLIQSIQSNLLDSTPDIVHEKLIKDKASLNLEVISSDLDRVFDTRAASPSI